MRLEPKTVTLDNEEDDSELSDMSRRFWIGLALTVPLFAMTMAEMLGIPLSKWIAPNVLGCVSLHILSQSYRGQVLCELKQELSDFPDFVKKLDCYAI